MKTTDQQILELCDEFKKFMASYVENREPEPGEETMEYIENGFNDWWHKRNWQYRNDKAWELVKAASYKAGIMSK